MHCNKVTKASYECHRTAKLWLQYMRMLEILRQFLRSERSGNWNLHMNFLKNMVAYLVAAGHNNYTRSLLLYLQHLQTSFKRSADAYRIFKEGLHVIRRSDHY